MSNLYTIFSTCCVIIPPLLNITSQNSIYFAHTQPIHHRSHLCPVTIPPHGPCPVRIPFLLIPLSAQSDYHIFCPCPVNIPLFLPKSSYLHHLSYPCHNISCPCPLRLSPLLPMSSHNTTSPAHVILVQHLTCPCQFRISALLAMSSH